MATTGSFFSDVRMTSDNSEESTLNVKSSATSSAYPDRPSSPVMASKDMELASQPTPVNVAGILSPKTSSSSLSTVMKRTRAPLSPKRQRPESRDGDDSPVSSPKRRRVISARLPTPSVSRRSSANLAAVAAAQPDPTIPRSFAELECSLALIASSDLDVDMLSPDESTMSIFERLPTELNDMIFSHLDYKSRISLSQVNRFMNHMVNPQLAPFEDKFSFVMNAEQNFPRHWPSICEDEEDEDGDIHEHPGNFACYVCFRVRGPNHFDDYQTQAFYTPTQAPAITQLPSLPGKQLVAAPTTAMPQPTPLVLRRYCIDCGIHFGLHKPGDIIITKAQKELRVCACRHTGPNTSEKQCLHCQNAGPEFLHVAQ